jgi:hypothetical protein
MYINSIQFNSIQFNSIQFNTALALLVCAIIQTGKQFMCSNKLIKQLMCDLDGKAKCGSPGKCIFRK